MISTHKRGIMIIGRDNKKITMEVFMKLKNLAFYSISMVVLLGTSGCAHYRTQPLKRLVTHTTDKNVKSVSFAYHEFNTNDCKRFFDRNVLAKGYQPIHIAINNNSSRCLNLFKENFSLQCISADEIAHKVHTNTTARVLAYGIPGLFIWPLLIPAVVDGMGSSESNKKLDEDFSRKELSDQVIAPCSKVNGIVFVPTEKFEHDFTITLVDANTQEKFTLSPSKPSVKIQ